MFNWLIRKILCASTYSDSISSFSSIKPGIQSSEYVINGLVSSTVVVILDMTSIGMNDLYHKSDSRVEQPIKQKLVVCTAL